MSAAFVELNQDELDAILAGARIRGQYVTIGNEFMQTDLPMVSINLESGPLAGKEYATVRQGFVSAQDKVEGLKVVATKGKIVLTRSDSE